MVLHIVLIRYWVRHSQFRLRLLLEFGFYLARKDLAPQIITASEVNASKNWITAVVFASLQLMENTFSSAYLKKIGARGGKRTLKKKGKKFFGKISMMRKNFRGGRPKKVKE
jgi:hypothetical protein